MANTLTSTQVARAVAGTDFGPGLTLPKINAVHVKFIAGGASVSTDTVIQMIAVPDGAKIIDGMVWRTDTTLVDNTAWGVGDGSLTSRFATGNFSITTGVMMSRFTKGVMPYRVSLSASNEGASFADTIDFNVGATSSCVTIDLHMTVWYTLEGV